MNFLKKALLSISFLSLFLIISNSFAVNFDQVVGSDAKLDIKNSLTTKATADVASGGSGLSQKTVPDMVSNVIKVLLGFTGAIALIFIIWGGFDWMMSQGDKTKIGKARDRMVTAAIGLLIIAAAYAITDFVVTQITAVAG